MKSNQLSLRKHFAIIEVLLIALLIILSPASKAQTPENFSGKWEFNKASSDKAERGDASFNGQIILEIKQGNDSISFSNAYFIPGKKGIVRTPDKFLLNGKVTTDNTGSDPAKKFVKWSQDKKILTTNYVMTAAIDGVSQEFLTAMTYSLSEDRKTLVIEEFHKSKLNGESKTKKVYNKTP